MDLTNRKILQSLNEDSSRSLSDISEITNLSIPAVRERINKLKDSGIIKNYTIDIDYSALGYDIDIIIEIVIKNNLYKDFKTFIAEQSHVAFCYRISGDSCFLFKARFKTMQDVETFIKKKQNLYFQKRFDIKRSFFQLLFLELLIHLMKISSSYAWIFYKTSIFNLYLNLTFSLIKFLYFLFFESLLKLYFRFMTPTDMLINIKMI